MGCCSAKKGRKTVKGKAGAKASDKSKKGGKKPAVPGAKGNKGAATSKTSTSSKRPAAPKGKAPGGKGGPGAKSAPALKRAPADKRPAKTQSAVSSTKSGKSGPPSSGSSKNKNRPSGEAKSSADARLAKKRESHAKSLNKGGVKGPANTPANVTTATTRSPPYVPKKSGSLENPKATKIPAAPCIPSPRDNKKKHQDKPADKSEKKKKQEKQADKSTSASRASSSTALNHNSDGRPPRVDSRRVSRSKLPMQKLTISSHIEDGIVVSQWYYTELRELGTQPSSVADLLQGGPRQQLNLQQPQQQKAAT